MWFPPPWNTVFLWLQGNHTWFSSYFTGHALFLCLILLLGLVTMLACARLRPQSPSLYIHIVSFGDLTESCGYVYHWYANYIHISFSIPDFLLYIPCLLDEMPAWHHLLVSQMSQASCVQNRTLPSYLSSSSTLKTCSFPSFCISVNGNTITQLFITQVSVQSRHLESSFSFPSHFLSISIQFKCVYPHDLTATPNLSHHL